MLTAPFASAVYGLASSLSWGAADFSAGLASRRSHARVMVVIVNAIGVLLAAALALALGQPWPAAPALLWGLAAGLSGALGLGAFYQALADGPMGVVAPTAAVIGATVPVIVGAATEGLPQARVLAGFGLALLGVALVSRTAGGALRASRGMGLAVIAGLGFGGFFILIHAASAAGLFWVLAASKLSSTLLMLGLALAARQRWQVAAPELRLSVLAGVLDVGGNAFYLLAAQAGRLDIAVVLSSLYPAATVLLARAVLKEPFSRSQAAGIAAMLAALPLIVL